MESGPDTPIGTGDELVRWNQASEQPANTEEDEDSESEDEADERQRQAPRRYTAYLFSNAVTRCADLPQLFFVLSNF